MHSTKEKLKKVKTVYYTFNSINRDCSENKRLRETVKIKMNLIEVSQISLRGFYNAETFKS